MLWAEGQPRWANKAPLNQERTLSVALAVADSEGIGAVTMPADSPRELGVEAASLYHHVRGRKEILDGLVETVASKIELPKPSASWRQSISQRAHHTRATLRENSVGGEPDGPHGPARLATLRLLETGIRYFREGGFSIVLAAHAISTVDSYNVHGFVLQEVNLPFRDESHLAAMTGAIMETFPASEFPDHPLRADPRARPEAGYDYGQEFDSGLEVVLDGLAALLEP